MSWMAEILITIFIMNGIGIYLSVHHHVQGFMASVFLIVFTIGIITIVSAVMKIIDLENELQKERDST